MGGEGEFGREGFCGGCVWGLDIMNRHTVWGHEYRVGSVVSRYAVCRELAMRHAFTSRVLVLMTG